MLDFCCASYLPYLVLLPLLAAQFLIPFSVICSLLVNMLWFLRFFLKLTIIFQIQINQIEQTKKHTVYNVYTCICQWKWTTENICVCAYVCVCKYILYLPINTYCRESRTTNLKIIMLFNKISFASFDFIFVNYIQLVWELCTYIYARWG